MSPEQKIKFAQSVEISYGDFSLRIEKGKTNNSSLSGGFGIAQAYQLALEIDNNSDYALSRIGLASLEQRRLVYRYLDNVISKNSKGNMGRGHDYELDQIKFLRDSVLAPMFPELIKHPVLDDKGGRTGKDSSSKRWESGGFDQRD